MKLIKVVKKDGIMDVAERYFEQMEKNLDSIARNAKFAAVQIKKWTPEDDRFDQQERFDRIRDKAEDIVELLTKLAKEI